MSANNEFNWDQLPELSVISAHQKAMAEKLLAKTSLCHARLMTEDEYETHYYFMAKTVSDIN